LVVGAIVPPETRKLTFNIFSRELVIRIVRDKVAGVDREVDCPAGSKKVKKFVMLLERSITLTASVRPVGTCKNRDGLKSCSDKIIRRIAAELKL
jgi:hypothetical protein